MGRPVLDARYWGRPFRRLARSEDRHGRLRAGRASAGVRGDHRCMNVTLHLAQQPDADELLGRSPLAALVGMLLDQQVPMEWAFAFRVQSERVA